MQFQRLDNVAVEFKVCLLKELKVNTFQDKGVNMFYRTWEREMNREREKESICGGNKSV